MAKHSLLKDLLRVFRNDLMDMLWPFLDNVWFFVTSFIYFQRNYLKWTEANMVLALWKMHLWQIWLKKKLISCRISRLSCDVIHFEKAKQGEVKLILFIEWSSTIFQYDVLYNDNQSLKNIFKCQLFSWRSRLRSWSHLWRRGKDFWSRFRLRRRSIKVEVGRKNLKSKKVISWSLS